MCGICGVYFFDRARVVDERDVIAMRETMVHRGPDGSGSFVRGHVGLGHRRLSIVDLAGGGQPMTNEDGTIWISFNGEIYNHRELRPWLMARGHVFRTQADTEAILHLYEEEGEAGFTRLNGIFAFALYDQRQDRTLLVRDRFGVKPLYYRVSPEGVLFGSEIKAILAYPGVRAAVNWTRVPDFLRYASVYGDETLFSGINELQPGYLLRVDEAGARLQRYWDLPAGRLEKEDEREERAHVQHLLQQAVRRQLMSDVPLGAFLSGGVDSSLLVALMAQLQAEPVKTFSIGFAEEGYNEFAYSRAVARRFHTDHTEITLHASEFFDALPRLVWHYDEPIALAASVPLYFLSRETKGKATVILTGEGADELFLGYGKYLWARKHARLAAVFQRLCPPFARAPLLASAKRVVGPQHLLLDRLAMAPGDVAASFYHQAAPALLNDLCAGRAPSAHEGSDADLCRHLFDDAPPGRDFLSRMTYMDFKTFLTTLLMKQDKMSMAASIESRVPYLDHELVEYGYRLATARKLRGGVSKSILKEIAAEHLPAELVHRQKKGFPVPVTPWFQAPATRRRLEEVLLDPRTLRRGIFKQGVVEDHLSGVARGERGQGSDATYLIWNLVNFELWQRVFIDAPPARAQQIPQQSTHVPLADDQQRQRLAGC
jgi:asparagine synthase (glutamine-hydrolysing)